MIIRVNSFIVKFVYYYPLLSIALTSIDGKFSRLLAQFAIFVFIMAEFQILKNRNRKKRDHLIFIGILLFFIFVFIARQGVWQLTNSDFYSFILILLSIDIFANSDYRQLLKNVMLNEKRFAFLIIGFYFFLAVSVLFSNGIVYGDTGIPELHGPYEFAHALAYLLLVIYSLSSLMKHYYNKKIYLYLMIATGIFVAMTGVRTAFLAMVVIVLADYYSLKSFGKKSVVAIVSLTAFWVIYNFTDIISNSAIIEKTILAASKATGITNGRELFNAYLFNHFSQFSFPDKMFGVGINNIKTLMSLRFGPIHAHNDVLNILLGYGIIGSIFFWTMFIRYIKNSKTWLPYLAMLIVLIWFNGLYMYHAFVPCMHLIAIFIDEIYESKGRNNGRRKINYGNSSGL